MASRFQRPCWRTGPWLSGVSLMTHTIGEGKVTVITGGRNSGKTSLCLKVAEFARVAGINMAGIISPGRFEGGIKTGIFAEDVKTGQRKLMASRLTRELTGFEIGPWSFDTDVYEWAGSALADASRCQLLLIDELGPLEFESGKAWQAGLTRLREFQYDHALVVVRPECLTQFTETIPYPEVIDLDKISMNPGWDDAFLTNLFIDFIKEPTAGIILAAGGSTRMATSASKVLLDWHGVPLIQHVVRTALDGGLDPVIVVTGKDHQRISEILIDEAVQVINNPAWQTGQSSSVRAGLQSLPDGIEAAAFMLADQPFVTPLLLVALQLRQQAVEVPIIIPVVGDKRCNPVIFARQLFPDLLQLQGDAGGRQLFSRYPFETLPWSDERLPLDIDTAADYERIRSL